MGGGIVVLVAIAVFLYFVTRGTGAHTAAGTPTPRPTVATSSQATAVDGIGCLGSESLQYHIHQHLALYDNGKSVQVPALIGIPNYVKKGQRYANCYYWIHVHDLSGILHVESPIKKTYSLGNFFDIWAKTSSSTVAPKSSFVALLRKAAQGKVTAFVAGKKWHGSYRSIPLTDHEVITVEIGKPVVPPRPYTNWSGT